MYLVSLICKPLNNLLDKICRWQGLCRSTQHW